MKRVFWLGMALVLPAAAQPKLLVNAKTDARSASSGLEREFKALLGAQPQPAWIGYSVPSVRYGYFGCDYVRDGFSSPGVVHLEPPDHVVILFRVESGAVNRVRSVSPDCEIDAGGLPMHWLNDVAPAQSIALLSSLIPDRERIGGGVLTAIAQHADPAADQVVDRYTAPDQPQSLRLQAVSWEGSWRGRHGFEVLKKLVASDPDERIRERAISALGSSKEPEAAELLIATARNDANPKLRQQAVSTLSSKRVPGAAGVLSGIIANDPDPQVRRRAVSALHNLPDGEGIPILIGLVKTTKDAEVRKQAMSSLQSSRDPRAVAFFEEVLKH